jgi:uncharacterized protein
MQLIGRTREIEKLNKLMHSSKSEFLAVYGRRRVGKTFLLKEHFNNQFDFYATGLAKGNTKQQLTNFTISINQHFGENHAVPENWLLAFHLLIKVLEKTKSAQKRVLFIDEMPWMDTKKSDFMMGLEFFWNAWASATKDILLIVCGSDTPWIINPWRGIYNRVTERMEIEPFSC